MGDAGTQGGSHPTLSTPTSARPALQQPVTVSVAAVTVSAIVRGMTHLASKRGKPLTADQVADMQSMLDDLLEGLDACAAEGDPDPEEVDELMRDADCIADVLSVHWRGQWRRMVAIGDQRDAATAYTSIVENVRDELGHDEPESSCDPLSVIWWRKLTQSLASELDAEGIDTSADPKQCTCPPESSCGCLYWDRYSCRCAQHGIEAVQA